MITRSATTNAPESMKKGLIKDRDLRARRIQFWAIRHRIDFRFIQEGGTYAERIDQEFNSRKVLWAKFNDFVKGRQIGNGLDGNRLRWKFKLLESIPVGTGENQINLGVFLATARFRPGKIVKLYVVHKPTRRAVNKELRPVVDQVLKDHTHRDDLAGIPWQCGGDFNGDPPPIGRDLADHGVDSIRGSKHFKKIKQDVYRKPRLSDHPFLVAVSEFGD